MSGRPPARRRALLRTMWWSAQLGSFLINGFVLTPILCLVLYDRFVFLPKASAFSAELRQGRAANADLPAAVREMLHAAYGGKRGLAVAVARLMLFDSSQRRRGWEWQVTFLLSSELFCLHYSQSEIAEMFAVRAYVGDGQFGLLAGAEARFARSLSDLSREEAAELVAITFGPPLMLSSAAVLELRKAAILQRAGGGG